MSVATGNQVTVNLRANVTPYIAAMRQATLATERLNAAIRLTGVSSAAAAAQHSAATAALTAQSAAASASATAQAQAAAAVSASTTATKAQTAATTAAASAERARLATLTKIGKNTAAFGAVALASLAVAAVAYARFEKQMSGVAAVADATSEEMRQLSEAAIDAGAATAFSATQAAKAEEELAKVGISVSDILGGALLGSLSLAAAGQLELGRSAEIAGQAMKVFNLEGEDVGRIADTLANGANKSAADVEQLAQALSQGGLVAAQTGLNLEDTVGTLAAFADNALLGSDAGTSFKSMLQRLTPQSKEAEREMARLGISAYDAGGNFIGVEKFAGVLQSRLKDLTTEQRNTSLGIIFGSDAVRAANVLYKEGEAGIRGYIEGVSEVGAAARVAAVQMDNLAGDIEELKGAFETGLIQAGSDGNSALRELVQNITEMVRWFNELSPAVRQGVTQLLLVSGVIAVVGGGMLALTARVLSARAAFVALTASSPALAAALTTVAKAAGIALALYAVVSAMGAIDTAQNKVVPGLEDTTAALLEMGKAGDSVALDDLFEGLGQGGARVDDFGDALKRVQDQNFTDEFRNWTAGLFGFDTTITQSEEAISNLGQSLALLVQAGNAATAAEQFEMLVIQAEAEGVSRERLLELMPAYDEALKSQANTQALASQSTAEMTAELAGLPITTEQATEAIDALDNAIKRLTDQAFGVQNAAIAVEEAIDALSASVEENGTTLDIATEAGRNNVQMLQDLATSSAASVVEMARQGATQQELTAETERLRQQFYDTAAQFGFTAEEAAGYGSVLDDLPTVVSAEFLTPGLNEAKRNVEELISRIDRLDGRQVVTTVTTRNVVTGQTSVSQVRKQATGGFIAGPGTSTSDSIPALLSNGEYVIKAAAVARYGIATFDRLNSMRFASGGPVRMAQHLAGGGAVGRSSGTDSVMRLTQSDIAQLAMMIGEAVAVRPTNLDGQRVSNSVNQSMTFGVPR